MHPALSAALVVGTGALTIALLKRRNADERFLRARRKLEIS
jgi:hypothetical protein